MGNFLMDSTSVNDALGSAMSSVQTDVSSYITTALPYALGIAGVVLAITIGWKVFKRFAK